jgi:hypothetical protein
VFLLSCKWASFWEGFKEVYALKQEGDAGLGAIGILDGNDFVEKCLQCSRKAGSGSARGAIEDRRGSTLSPFRSNRNGDKNATDQLEGWAFFC